jgi:hypothetical protein
MSIHNKKLKGKTVRIFSRFEGESWAAIAYCPWCSLRKDVMECASEKRAVKTAFESVETHWKIDHK